MLNKKKLIGIFGGAFDPVHLGHIEVISELNNCFNFEKIHIIPSKQPILKAESQATPQDRIAMLKLALEGNKNAIIDTREIERDTPSYSIETLESLRKDYPQNALAMILGMDAFSQLPKWHDWNKLINLSHIIVVNRPGSEATFNHELHQFIEKHRTEDNEALYSQGAGLLHFTTIDSPLISSSEIRALLASGKSAETHLPPKVNQYIHTRGVKYQLLTY